MLPATMSAQIAAGEQASSARPDSVPWRPVLEYVMRSLAADILRAANDTAPKPWRIALPDSSPPWRAFGTHLERMLRARPPQAGERELDELTISAMRMSGDSAFVIITRAHTSQCPGGVESTGYANRAEVYVVRVRSRFWSAARAPYVTHGDRAACRTPERPSGATPPTI